MSHTVSIQPIHDGSVSCRAFPLSQTSLPCCGHNRSSRYDINISNISLGSQISQPRQMMENQGNLSVSSLKLADIYIHARREWQISINSVGCTWQTRNHAYWYWYSIFDILLFLAYYHHLIFQTELPEILVINELLTQCLACLHL